MLDTGKEFNAARGQTARRKSATKHRHIPSNNLEAILLELYCADTSKTTQIEEMGSQLFSQLFE